MDKYLLELLKEVNTIIIPGLGALTATNKEKGEYMFMPYLKHDDGTLARHIADKEGWSENEAKNLVAKYVRDIEAKLNTGESYDMYRFGTFRRNAAGDVEFEPWTESVQYANETMEPAAKEEEEPIMEDHHTENTLEEVTVAEWVSDEKNTVDDDLVSETSEYTPEIVQEPAQMEDPESELEVNVSFKTEYTEEQQWNDDLDLPPVNAKIERPKKPILEKAQKDSKKRKIPVLLLLFGVIILGAGTSVGIFYNEIKQTFFADNSADTVKLGEGKQFEFTEEPIQPEPEAEQPVVETKPVKKVEEQSETEEPKVEKTVSKPVKQKPAVIQKPEVKPKNSNTVVKATGSFHLIVGSFQNKQFADNFSKKATAAGHASKVLGPKGNFYLVTVGSYATEAEAIMALDEKKGSYPKVWLLKSD
jgi:hypothetical protein